MQVTGGVPQKSKCLVITVKINERRAERGYYSGQLLQFNTIHCYEAIFISYFELNTCHSKRFQKIIFIFSVLR